MLRTLLLVLALANGAFFVWRHGWLDAVLGTRADGEREPERLARQLRPETVRVLAPATTGRAVSTGSASNTASAPAAAPTAVAAAPPVPTTSASAASATAPASR